MHRGDAIPACGAGLKKNYGSTMIAALKTVLPVKQKSKLVVKKSIHSKVDAQTAIDKSLALRKSIRQRRQD